MSKLYHHALSHKDMMRYVIEYYRNNFNHNYITVAVPLIKAAKSRMATKAVHSQLFKELFT